MIQYFKPLFKPPFNFPLGGKTPSLWGGFSKCRASRWVERGWGFALLLFSLFPLPSHSFSLGGGRLLEQNVPIERTQEGATHWRIEAESPKTRVLWRGDTLDIISPQGLSLWWDEPLQAPCVITYRACVVVAGAPCDRLSDLNCFWMASIPSTKDADSLSPLPSLLSPLPSLTGEGLGVRPGSGERPRLPSGRFVESYRLQCYYLGYGGNHNTTTRFRRYDGDTLAITDPTRRPAILKEYTDSAHLLRPNHWYTVRIEVTSDGRTRYFIDDECLVDYLDTSPLLHGYFAFRTTWSHTRLTAFNILYKQT